MNQVVLLLPVSAAEFAALPANLMGIPQYYSITGGTIQVWPAPSANALASGLTLQLNLTTAPPYALASS